MTARTRRRAPKLGLAVVSGIAAFAALPAAAGAVIKFDRTDYGVGTHPAAIESGDFNEDGWPDIVSANINANTLSVLLNDGTGSFGAPDYIAGGSAPRALLTHDFNGDGNLDLAIANNLNGDGNVRIMFGDGAGSFALSANYPVSDWPYSIALGYLDGDDEFRLDLVTANSASNNVSILAGDGSGGFAPAMNVPVGTAPHGVGVGDIYNQGNPDPGNEIITANSGSDDVTVLIPNADGSRTRNDIPVGDTPDDVVVARLADVTFAGYEAVAVANSGSDDVSVFGGQVFGGNPFDFFAGDLPTAIAAGVFDGTAEFRDSRGGYDLVTANWFSDDVSVLPRVLDEPAGDTAFGAAHSFPVGTDPFDVIVRDFNKDGQDDIATANWNSRNVTVLTNDTAPPPPVEPTPPPSMFVDPQLRFGPQFVNSTGVSRLLVYNSGSGPLQISDVYVTGDLNEGSEDFEVVSETCTSQPVVPFNAEQGANSCAIKVAFTPANANRADDPLRHGILRIVSNDPFDSIGGGRIALTGEVERPDCAGLQADIIGTSGTDTLRARFASTDVVALLGGDDRFRHPTEDDFGDYVCGGGGDDDLKTGVGPDVVKGGSGDDEIRGSGENDRLVGQSGDDELHGGPGDDDVCIGGGGEDTADAECETQVGIE